VDGRALSVTADAWPVPGLPRADVARPGDLGALLALVADGRQPLAGGTDLIVRASHGEGPLPPLAWIGGVTELGELAADRASITVGAGVSLARLVASRAVRSAAPALADAADIVGSVQIRTVATLAGNLCNASPAADTIPALIAHEARAMRRRADGPARMVAVEQFLTGPGRTVLEPGEIVHSITVTPLGPGEGSAYRRFTARASMDLAFVGVAARIGLDHAGAVAAARIVLGAVGPTAIVAGAAAAELFGRRPDPVALAAAGEAAAAEARPITDLRASAAYRRRLVAVLVADVVAAACARAR
jgi:carbon-monoxide dehydrogenase medium subunit